MRVAIVSAADDAMLELQSLTQTSLQEYCKLYNYDLRLSKIAQKDRPAPWYKIKFIQQEFENGYDYVLWIDADAIIVKKYSLEKWIESDKDFYYSCNWLGMNSGVMLFKNTSFNMFFLKEVWNQKQFMHDPWWEQRAIIHLLDQGIYPSNSLKEIPSEIFNTDQYWGGCFVYHLSGVANSDRIRMFRKVLHKG